MRVEQSSKNATTALIFYVINSIFTFFSKSILIQFIGIEYSGLNSLFTNILGILNIAEMGMNTAVGYSLYKPLAEKDIKTINEILKLYKYLYRIVAIFILVSGLILLFFLQYMVNTTISIDQIRISFLLYLSSTVVSYLFTYLNVLPAANQQNYMVVRTQGIVRIIKNIIQIISIMVTSNYYTWLIIEIIGNIIGYFYTNFNIKKKYDYYKDMDNVSFKELIKKYKEVILKVRDLFFHRIGALVVNQTDNIIISYFCTLKEVGMYGNYMLVFSFVSGVFEQAFASITSSIGNLIINRGKKVTYEIWKELHILIVFLTIICCYLFYKLINYFISLWVGEEYILSKTIVLAITLNIGFKIIKQPIDKFKEAFGIFWDKQAPFIEAIVNLVVSIALARKIGILGVVIGTVVSNMIITAIWKPYIVFKNGFNEKFIEYIKLNGPLFLLSMMSIITTNTLINLKEFVEIKNLMSLVVIASIYLVCILTVSLLFFIPYKPFRNVFFKYLKIFKDLILKKAKKIL